MYQINNNETISKLNVGLINDFRQWCFQIILERIAATDDKTAKPFVFCVLLDTIKFSANFAGVLYILQDIVAYKHDTTYPTECNTLIRHFKALWFGKLSYGDSYPESRK